MSKDNEEHQNYTAEEWKKRFDLPSRSNNVFPTVNNLFSIWNLNPNPNFNNNVPGAAGLPQNYYTPQVQPPSYSTQNQGFPTATPALNGGKVNNTQNQPPFGQRFFNLPGSPYERKDTHKPTNPPEYNQSAEQGVNQSPATDPTPFQNQGTPTNPEGQTGQNFQYGDNSSPASSTNTAEHFSKNFSEAESEQPVQPLTNEQVGSNLQIQIDENKRELLKLVLDFIENTTVGINEQRKTNKEADISQNAQQLFHKTEELFYYYSVAAELEQNATKKTEWTKKAAEQLKAIQANPLYSKEINNEQERRDVCERVGRFIGATTSRVIGLGLGFGAAVAVASLMIPPAMVLYGPIIVAGPVIAAGAGGAAAFMANKLGYKIADITLSNTTALAGRLLDWSKNSLRDWWNKDKEQVKALTTLKNSLLKDIEKSQEGLMLGKQENNQAKITEHLENLYINTSVLTDLETSIVEQRKVKAAQEKALEEWKKTSLLNKAAKKIGESETWKSISETNASNICKKLGIITGKIVGLAVAAGLGAAAAIAITSSIGAAATILYGPMAVVGITTAAGIAAGAVGYKVANPVATWSFKKVGQVADLAKNATYDVGKFMAVGTKNIVMGKGKHSSKEDVKKDASQSTGHSK